MLIASDVPWEVDGAGTRRALARSTTGVMKCSSVMVTDSAPTPETLDKWSVRQLVRIASVMAQLGLALAIIQFFELESKSFKHLFALTIVGFAVHWALPARARMPFLSVLSVAGMGLVLGWKNALFLVVFGLALIGIAHLPIAFRARVVLMVLAAGAAGGVRTLQLAETNPLQAPWSPVVWTMLGSMFMFRMIIYLYDLRHDSAPFGFWRATSYFFMLPNATFTLFPLVDYQTFNRVYYDADEAKIYQRGASWIFRGLGQLLIYRLIYQNWCLAPQQIVTLGDAWQNVLTTFAMYFKVVGTFAIAMGTMQLFGFHLPLPNHDFLLSSSFTDFWRRTNIYWKDFIQKMFFNPAMVRLNRHFSSAVAMGLATLYAFVLTWALHSYQWFWIRGDFPVTWQDIAMWSWLGACLYLTMLWESKRPKKRTLKKPVRTLKGDVLLGLKIIGLMTAMASMWTYVWVSPSWSATKAMLAATTNASLRDVGFVLGTLLLYGTIAVLWSRVPRESEDAQKVQKASLDPKGFWRAGGLVYLGSSALLGGYALVTKAPEVLSFAPRFLEVADNLHKKKINARDTAMLTMSYYDMLVSSGVSAELNELLDQKEKSWDDNPLVVQVDDYPDWVLEASKSAKFKGATFTTNRWRMRDQDYAKEKPPGTYRINLYGQSVEQGSGVGDGEAYEALVEARLNAEKVKTSSVGVRRFEILNFANGGYGPLHKLALLEKTGFTFEPDAILWVAIADVEWVANEVVNAHDHPRGLAMIPFPEVKAMLAAAGIQQSDPPILVAKKVEPIRDQLATWIYARVVEVSKKHGVRPLLVLLAQPEEDPKLPDKMAHELALAKDAGFETIDLRDVYEGERDVRKFWIRPYDHHPTAEAHRRIAQKLYDGLVKTLGL